MNERAIAEHLNAEMWKRIRAEEQAREPEPSPAEKAELVVQRKAPGWGLVEYRRRQKAGDE